jgi:dTDP-4-dehydrorhamnose reductase
MRLLIFGSGGQLGRELADTAGNRTDLLATCLSRSQADIADPAKVHEVLSAIRPDVIVNAAAYTKVDLAESETDAAWQANCKGPATLAAACEMMGAPLIHISTDYVFDGTKTSPYVETDPVAPLGVYGASKEAGETAVRDRCRRHVILRTSWVYGPHGTNFLKTMLRLAGERESWGVVADQVGTPTATPDLANAIFATARRAHEPDCPWGTYNFAGAGEANWHEFASVIISAQVPITGRRPDVRAITTAEYPTKVRRPANSRLDSRRFADAFGVTARPWRERVPPIVLKVLQRSGDVQ